jgi:hypothetical protein
MKIPFVSQSSLDSCEREAIQHAAMRGECAMPKDWKFTP